MNLITRSIDFNEKAGRIVVAWDIFHWVHLKMVAPTTDCKWMVIGQKWVDPIERSRTLYSSMDEQVIRRKLGEDYYMLVSNVR